MIQRVTFSSPFEKLKYYHALCFLLVNKPSLFLLTLSFLVGIVPFLSLLLPYVPPEPGGAIWTDWGCQCLGGCHLRRQISGKNMIQENMKTCLTWKKRLNINKVLEKQVRVIVTGDMKEVVLQYWNPFENSNSSIILQNTVHKAAWLAGVH